MNWRPNRPTHIHVLIFCQVGCVEVDRACVMFEDPGAPEFCENVRQASWSAADARIPIALLEADQVQVHGVSRATC